MLLLKNIVFILLFGLVVAFRHGRVRAQRQSTSRDFWPFTPDPTGIPVIDSVMRKDVDSLRKIVLENKASVNERDSSGKTVMHIIGK